MSSLHHSAELRARSVSTADQVQRLEELAKYSEGIEFPYNRTPQDIPT